jgi:hypothetical protein
MEKIKMDITFDLRSDANGKDPDSSSKTLRLYHKTLWSKKLPNGKDFILTDTVDNVYLYHKSELGEYFLSSDAFIHTYWHWKRTQDLIKNIPNDELEYFEYLSYTIGGIIIFPYNRVDNLPTMNQERGCNIKINDRMDLTLQCIKLYYNDEDSPLFKTIKRYDNYFKLFDNFEGYCKYFLLQDLVSKDFLNINFFLPFNGFIHNPLPNNVDEYNKYKKNSIEFLHKRNNRIKEYCDKILL